jgi:hypothetical protein
MDQTPAAISAPCSSTTASYATTNSLTGSAILAEFLTPLNGHQHWPIAELVGDSG